MVETALAERTILIVEDDLKIRTIYRQMLTEEGYGVDEAANGEEAAISILRNKNIRLVILDINMPMVDGVSFFDLVRFCQPKAKVIIASVYQKDDQKRMIPTADSYHDKIEGPAALIAKVKAML